MVLNIYGYPAVNPFSFWTGLLGTQASNPLSSAVQAIALERLLASQAIAQRQALLIQTLTGLQSYGQQLYTAANALTLNNVNNVFAQRATTSSAPDILTAQALPNATITSYQITITQLAVAQQNVGTALTSTSTTAVTPGTNTFTLTVGGTTYNLSVNILSTDTNQTALGKIANVINAANAGVTAKVINDTTAGTSRLQIMANKTGTASAFTLADVTGNVVTATGANTVNTMAANAQYTVNGISYTSQSNTVLLDQGRLTVNFFKTSTAQVTLTVGPDTQAISGAVNNLVNAYNSLKSYATLNAGFLVPRIGQSLTNAYELKAPELNALGITRNSNGTLTVDQSRLTMAVSQSLGAVKSAFGGADGFAVNLALLGQEITTSPLWNFAAPQAYQTVFFPRIYSYLLTLNQSRFTAAILPTGTLVNLLV
ncbi:flagellar filament capping protein FliD [Gelria sp. Kuro-4]|uniref:flagellar filament capping protein FliD n=1 Tax=Gelria sp. Kuro-4 TaxID=2796927 RepID=UPI001BEF92BC|nr:flagellar filament capping protein FliD [Gelria sp. Kuro-4]BCV24248.1 flagellar hook-associated protein 2 [Gelria sp. Kuro-4]